MDATGEKGKRVDKETLKATGTDNHGTKEEN